MKGCRLHTIIPTILVHLLFVLPSLLISSILILVWYHFFVTVSNTKGTTQSLRGMVKVCQLPYLCKCSSIRIALKAIGDPLQALKLFMKVLHSSLMKAILAAQYHRLSEIPCDSYHGHGQSGGLGVRTPF